MLTTLDDLTEREVDVLRLIAQGYPNQGIWQSRVLPTGTVRSYVSNIFAKIGVSDRTQATLLARTLVE
ncbi:MAG: LuxR C-terminal-related transcriptional regulator [Chloroflexota bacterium]